MRACLTLGQGPTSHLGRRPRLELVLEQLVSRTHVTEGCQYRVLRVILGDTKIVSYTSIMKHIN